VRLIARIDVKNDWVIKGIHLEGLRKIAEPNELAMKYYQSGIDEIVFMDAVASLYDRNNLFGVIEKACEKIFVPITVGGGLRSLSDVSSALNAGADKVVINTGAVRRLDLIADVSAKFGSQAVIGSIEAKRKGEQWEAYIDNGREPTGLNVLEWAQKLETAGVGEILVTSIDMEGTMKGFDIDLVHQLQDATSCPVIVSGGYGQKRHLEKLAKRVFPSAIACAAALHYEKTTVAELKEEIKVYREKYGDE